jgi:hypothetical protein
MLAGSLMFITPAVLHLLQVSIAALHGAVAFQILLFVEHA